MILTVQQLLTDAMGLVGATEMDETPAASDLEVVKRAANVMIDRWSSQHLLLRSTTVVVFNTTAGKANYTIGSSGCDITSSKPLSVQYGYVTDSNIDYKLDVITKELYDSYQDKDVSTSRPWAVAYDPDVAQQTAQKGTFYLYYTPDKIYPVTVNLDSYLNEFVNLSDTVSFEPAYYEALIYNLALRIFRRYNPVTMPIPQDIAVIANDSLNNIRTLNSVRVQAACDIPGAGARPYNIYTDGY